MPVYSVWFHWKSALAYIITPSLERLPKIRATFLVLEFLLWSPLELFDPDVDFEIVSTHYRVDGSITCEEKCGY